MVSDIQTKEGKSMTDDFVLLTPKQLAHVPHAIMAILEAESRMDEDIAEEVMRLLVY